MANSVKFGKTEFKVGDTIRVHQKIEEEGKTRIQIFEGLVIAIKNSGENKSFTVRKIAVGAIGVERIWQLNTPWIEKIELKKIGSVKQAKLYFVRNLVGKKARRISERGIAPTIADVIIPEVKVEAEAANPEVAVETK